MDSTVKNKIFDYIESEKENMIASLSDLIAYPSYQQEPSDGAPFGRPVRECLDRALEICSGFGLVTRNFDGYAGTVELPGYNCEPELGILSHLDVVPEGTGWTSDPYKARVDDGKIYGRGAIDDKGPSVAVIYALKAIKELGIPLKRGVRLILGTNEENGSADMKYYLSKQPAPKYTFTPDGNYPVINIEKGMIRGYFSADIMPSASPKTILELSGGTVINAVPESAYAVIGGTSVSEAEAAIRRMSCGVSFSVKDFGGCIRIDACGKSAHASTPELGKNAVTALIKLLTFMDIRDDASRKLSSLSKLFPYGETDGSSLGIAQSDELSGALTCVLSIINYQAGKLEFKIDIRLPATSSVANVMDKLLPAAAGAGFRLDGHMGSEPHCVSEDTPFVRKLLSVFEEVTGKKGECIAIGGGTYVHEIEGGVAFGPEFIGDDNHMHSADEFIKEDDLIFNAKMFALAILRICAED